MKDKDLKKLRDVVALEIKNATRFLSMQQGTTNHKLDLVYERLEKVEDRLEIIESKTDAQTVDIHDLQEQVKGLQDEVVAYTEINTRRIDEIREHVGLSNP